MSDCPCPTVAPYCINRQRDICAECAEEGKLRRLEPETLLEWESFELPPFSELLEMNSYAKLAVLWLASHYLQRTATRDA